ncbi:glycosyltransferase family 4 protein [Chryseobacterium viscerum]|uniref:Glycosyltransferase WbuB n=1 Tax=Chryseobacterium viscerum TaxID=1037377 RepID=A0A316WN29_9FLAO|nr:glycosyltransferase family 4 protein [Chryseobacterium viscerum]KAB1230553.1 glycosyltransferase family 4 protein [Chryseobacterium viscerum]PWN61866.1 glycosyltransferase WbuB [Chryseobacterium viscerum]
MAKKVLIHSIVFAPDAVSTAYLYNDIAYNLKKNGFQVEVLSTMPHYNKVDLHKTKFQKKFLGLYYISDYKGIKVYHVPQKKYESILLRGFIMVYWHLLSFFLGMRIKNVDVIISPSPPLTIALVSIALAKLKNAKFIYNVQEIYPDFFVNQGKMKSQFVLNFLKKLEKFVYKHSDSLVTIDQNFKNTLVSRMKNPEKIEIIANFVDTELYHPINHPVVNKQLFPSNDNLKVMYAGNIGFAQDWEPLIEVAKKTKGMPVSYFVIGDGACKSWLKTEIETHQLNNISLIDYQARETIPHMINYADLHFIFMNKKLEKDGLPSKVYTIMACKKPLLVISNKNTPLYDLLENTDAAFLIENSSNNVNEELYNVIQEAMDHKDKLKMMGEKGFDMVQKDYTKEKVTGKYYKHISSLLNS